MIVITSINTSMKASEFNKIKESENKDIWAVKVGEFVVKNTLYVNANIYIQTRKGEKENAN